MLVCFLSFSFVSLFCFLLFSFVFFLSSVVQLVQPPRDLRPSSLSHSAQLPLSSSPPLNLLKVSKPPQPLWISCPIKPSDFLPIKSLWISCPSSPLVPLHCLSQLHLLPPPLNLLLCLSAPRVSLKSTRAFQSPQVPSDFLPLNISSRSPILLNPSGFSPPQAPRSIRSKPPLSALERDIFVQMYPFSKIHDISH